ncbi:MAG: thiamine diphosphokinase [Actinomycetota bacterium]|nr:thiamine diphosphokinase [Actinomycetota bacterium]
MRSAFIFCGGGASRFPLEVPDDALVVAADVGLAEANRLGVRVDLLVGDLDSVSAADFQAFEDSGGEVHRHPEDKDATDLDLAIGEAIAAGVQRVVVVGGDGGRLDHLIGNALVLTADRHAAVEIDAVFGAARVHVVRGRREIAGASNELISLFAVGEPARGVRTEGLRWALDGAELEPGSSLGVSNRFLGERAVIEVADGVVLVVRPDDQETA